MKIVKLNFFKNLAYCFFVLILFGFLANVHAGATNQSSIANALFDSNDAEYLSPDAAFKLDLSAIDAQTIKARFTVAPGYYLYKERIKSVSYTHLEWAHAVFNCG